MNVLVLCSLSTLRCPQQRLRTRRSACMISYQQMLTWFWWSFLSMTGKLWTPKILHGWTTASGMPHKHTPNNMWFHEKSLCAL